MKQINSYKINVVLAGNPNCGKTTLFNQLTGSTQYVGNWPGVTVEKKSGKIKNSLGRNIEVVDLPGIYSLSPYSPEETVAQSVLINDNPDVIINIADATNLERNLYLTTQLLELGKPTVVALNMCDIIEKNGDKINIDYLEKQFGVPFVPISASKNIGIDQLIEKTVHLYDKEKLIAVKNFYSPEVDYVLREIHKNRYIAVKLFEGDTETWRKYNFSKEQQKRILNQIVQTERIKNLEREMIIADERYNYICKVTNKAITRNRPVDTASISDKIDKVVTNKFLAIPLFLIIMLIIFTITFGSFGTLLRNGTEYIITDIIGINIHNLLTAFNVADWAKSLVVDGIIAGVGSVISFLPQIMLLFGLLSLLEDSGYMARTAFIMDKLLRYIGLSGKAFVPMIMGFGCTVPAILATRTLENEKDKKLTIMVTPFMSCSAKMPVYLLFASCFFRNYGSLVIFAIYLLGIVVAILSAFFFKNTVLKGKNAPFVMEIPPYRMPSPKSLWPHVRERLKDFLTRAGTVLLVASVIIWLLQSFDFSFQMVSADESMLATIGKLIAPIFSICGFGDWRASVSLVTGIMAKESIVSTLSVLYNNTGFVDAFTTLSAFSFLVFVLLYTPCIAALSAIHRELQSAKWTVFSIIWQIFVAWLTSSLVFQFGTLIQNIVI